MCWIFGVCHHVRNWKAPRKWAYDVILADLVEAIKAVKDHAESVESTRLDDWKAKVVEVENAITKLAEKIIDAEAHLEACLNEIETSMAFIAD